MAAAVTAKHSSEIGATGSRSLGVLHRRKQAIISSASRREHATVAASTPKATAAEILEQHIAHICGG